MDEENQGRTVKEDSPGKDLPTEKERREIRTTTEYLKCKLTNEEKKRISEDMAQACETIAKLTDDAKAVAAQFKSDIAKSEAIMKQAAQKIRNGYEMRQVDCEIEKYFNTGYIVCRRLDTYEEVYRRPMTSEEHQPALLKVVDTSKPITN